MRSYYVRVETDFLLRTPCYNKHMRKNRFNIFLLALGILIAASTPLAVMFLTTPLSRLTCAPQLNVAVQMCISNYIAVLYTFYGPPLLGSALILVSVLRRKQ